MNSVAVNRVCCLDTAIWTQKANSMQPSRGVCCGHYESSIQGTGGTGSARCSRWLKPERDLRFPDTVETLTERSAAL